jgi:hypothetical protein
VRVTIAVPASFERSTAEENDGDDGDEQHVAYRPRDGIYAIDVWTWTDDEGRPPLQVAADWIDGWWENTDFTDVRGTSGSRSSRTRPRVWRAAVRGCVGAPGDPRRRVAPRKWLPTGSRAAARRFTLRL